MIKLIKLYTYSNTNNPMGTRVTVLQEDNGDFKYSLQCSNGHSITNYNVPPVSDTHDENADTTVKKHNEDNPDCNIDLNSRKDITNELSN